MIVHKFGGTSVGNTDRFRNVVQIIQQQQAGFKKDKENSHESNLKNGTIVVVSAMSGVTDKLIKGARAAAAGKDSVYRGIKADLLQKHIQVAEDLLGNSPERLEVCGFIEDQLHELERLYRSIAILGEFTARGSDAVASFGERLSSTLLSAVMRENGIRSETVMAAEVLVSDDHYGSAEPLYNETRERLNKRIIPLLEKESVPIITGFLAATKDGVATTLGRGGSDFSAAIIGACLDADEVWIWSDVNGILTADPNIVENAHTLKELSYSEAAELAYYGADVLHPKTIRPLAERDIPLRILNSFCPSEPGTLITNHPSENRRPMPAIISTKGLTMIVIGSQDDSWTLQNAASALQALSDGGIEVPLFSQSFSEHHLNLVVKEENKAYCLQILAHQFGLTPTGDNAEFQFVTKTENGAKDMVGKFTLGIKENVATISVVGNPDKNKNGVVSKSFAALGKYGIRVITVAQSGSEYSVSFCIPEDQMENTVKYLHQELGLETLE